MPQRRSPILEKLAELYAASQLGQTGVATRSYSMPFLRLLDEADCRSGDRYENALLDLASADGAMLELKRHRRIHDIERVVVPLACEAALFARVGRVSPTAERAAWSALLHEAAGWAVPQKHGDAWRRFCEERAALVERGEGWQPFRRSRRARARRLLEVATHLLAWPRPALLRTVSAQVAGHSKFLERGRATLQALLHLATAGQVSSFADLGISDNPRKIFFYGPLRLHLSGTEIDYAHHAGASSLAEEDLTRAESFHCTAPRCVTVENETTFHELTRLGSGDLFVHTSYPNRATVEFLRRLPATLPRYHFGDTDPWGFDVLRALRVALAPVEIQPLHMTFRSSPGSEPLTARDCKKLTVLLSDPRLANVRSELEKMCVAGTKDEQESLAVCGAFPYHETSQSCPPS